ncbi:MAG: hypothetical protein SGJ20_22580 [Planctomycetota bacterium]|nr:hypothetical protein [Planctomycetota bacterium]
MKKLLILSAATMMMSVATGCNCCNPLRREVAMPVMAEPACNACEQQNNCAPAAPGIYSAPNVIPGPVMVN